MFGNEDFMSSFDAFQKPDTSDLSLAHLDDTDWLSPTPDVDCLVPDVDVCDQGPNFPIVPSYDAEFDEPDTGTALFDVGLVKPQPRHHHQQTASSSSLESWQGETSPRAGGLPPKAKGLRRVETAASTLTTLDTQPDSPHPATRVANSGLRPCLSLPDLTRIGADGAAGRGARGRNATVATSPPKNLGVDTRSPEQRREDRMAALERFREKKRNRTFTKKVRYECRKQLADSRPRVKGRFVRKNEIGLYEKYGETYREHLEELEDGVVPSL